MPAPGVAVERVSFVMEVATDARAAALDAAADRIVGHLDTGERVAFVTLGDPSIYSTFGSLGRCRAARRPGVPIEVVPGIMAFQDLAARTATGARRRHRAPRARPGPRLGGRRRLARPAADPHAAVVVYKGGAQIGKVAATLADHDRLDGAVLGELLGLPGAGWRPSPRWPTGRRRTWRRSSSRRSGGRGGAR